ncbi:MAG: cyclohexanone monooxygenase, partial [Alphaproteobacteria bacterium]
QCQETATCFLHTPDSRKTFDVSPEEREAFWQKQYDSPGFAMWVGNFKDMMLDRDANAQVSDFVARKIRERVTDPRVAELLIPDDHGFGTRRVPQESGYFEVYNQPNVELISILETPIERMTETGLETADREFEFDLIVYATGFDAITGSFNRIDIQGVDGQRLKDKWTPAPSTFVGVMVDGFPNMFMVMGPHTSLGNIPRCIEYNVEWVSDLIQFLSENGSTYANPRTEAVDEWTKFVIKSNEGLLSAEVDSWMTGINQNIDGRQVRIIARYSGTAPAYREWCNRVASGGYQELTME